MIVSSLPFPPPLTPVGWRTDLRIALDALIVAAETQERYLGTKKTWTRKIFLITDAESPVEDEDWEQIVSRLQVYNVSLTIVFVLLLSFILRFD